MSGLFQDFKTFARKTRRRPVWTVAVMAVLALGISASTAMFSGYDAWLLRPLPFAEPDRLVELSESQPRLGVVHNPVSPQTLADWREAQTTLAALEAFQRVTFNLADEGDPARIRGLKMTHGLFPMLGVQPVVGRSFLPEEDGPGEPGAVALISHRLWRERYGADAQVVGHNLRLDGQPHVIVGVMPKGFRFPEWAEIWTPLGLESLGVARDKRWLRVVGRLRHDTSIARSRLELASVAARMEQSFPETNDGWGVHVGPLRELWLPSVIGVALTASMAAGVFVLLIVCANVAGLMLAEVSARSHEFALRSALGASRRRLVQSTLVESTSLALVAGLLGSVMAVIWVDWMLGWAPIEPPYLFRFEFNGRVLFYSFVMSLVAGAGSALAPVVRAAGVRMYEELKTGTRGVSASRGTTRLRRTLVVAELGLSTALVIGAMLLARSLWEQQSIDPGYRTRQVYTTRLSLSGRDFESAGQRLRSVDRINQSLHASSAISSVGAVSRLPSGGGYTLGRFEPPGRAAKPGEGERASLFSFTGQYLDTLGIALTRGRSFTSVELREGGDVAIVSDSLARRLWDAQDVVGRRLRNVEGATGPWLTVVGVASNVAGPQGMVGGQDRPRHQVYRPYASAPTETVDLVVGSEHPPASVAQALREGVRRTGVAVPVSEVLTMDEALLRSQWVTRFFSVQLALYSVVALLIAAVGLYGLVADSVNGRTREIALRLAVGADRQDIMKMILRGAFKLGTAGVAIGLTVGLGGAWLAGSMLQDVNPADPAVLSVVVGLLTVTCVLASYVPASRAAAVDPAHSLRAE